MLRYAIRSLLDTPHAVIAHGCNAAGGFGGGVAEVIKNRWPEVRNAYKAAWHAGRIKLGEIQWVRADGGRVLVANCITQPTYDRTGRRHVDYAAFRSCMEHLAHAGRSGVPGTPWSAGFKTIAMPRIGASLGGGDWQRLEAIVEDVLTDFEVEICVPDPKDVPAWRSGTAPAVPAP